MKHESVQAEAEYEAPVAPIVAMSLREIVWVMVSGLVIGLVVAGLYLLMNTYIFGAVLCRPQSMAECANAPSYAMSAATFLGAIAGLASLARIRIYRPLLVVIASAIALWGLDRVVGSLAWYQILLSSMVLYALAYGLFAWLARIRNFVLTIVMIIVAVVIARLALTV